MKLRLTVRSRLLGSAFPKPCFCCALFAQVLLNDWRLILAKNNEKILPTTHNNNPNNRTHIVKFRVTEKEKLTLELCCKRLNISMSTLIRQSLLGKPVQHTVLVAGGGEDTLNILSAHLGKKRLIVPSGKNLFSGYTVQPQIHQESDVKV